MGSRSRRRSRSRSARSRWAVGRAARRARRRTRPGADDARLRARRASSSRRCARRIRSGSPHGAGSAGSGSRRPRRRSASCRGCSRPCPRPRVAIVHLPARLWPRPWSEPGLEPRGGTASRRSARRPGAGGAGRDRAARAAPCGRGSPRARSAGWPRAARSPGWRPVAPRARRVGPARRGLVGRRRPRRLAERGQALLLVIGAAFAILFAAPLLAALGGAVTGASRAQRAADLVALSGARSLRDDFPRLFTPSRLARRGAEPAPSGQGASTSRERGGRARGRDPKRRRSRPAASLVSRRRSFAPLRVRAEVTASVDREALPGQRTVGPGAAARRHPDRGERRGRGVAAAAVAGGCRRRRRRRVLGPARLPAGQADAPRRRGGVRPAGRAAARRAGSRWSINSAYRSDAEQARLFAAAPRPALGGAAGPVASPLRDRARPRPVVAPTAGWPRTRARFGFLKRYSWEPWHFGYAGGPAPCSPAATAIGVGRLPPTAARRDGAGLAGFVPARFREPILRAAARWNVSAALLAAQLMAESNFNPFAVSPAGAQGIAQFMPGTAAPTASTTRSTPPAAIDAQAHLMSDLLRQFAARSRSPSPPTTPARRRSSACDCVPRSPRPRPTSPGSSA